MIPDILSVIEPAIDWPNFLLAAKKLLGYDAGRLEGNRPLKDYARFLAVLRHFKDPLADHGLDNLRAVTSELRFLSFGFLVNCDQETLFELMQSSDLDVITNSTIVRDNLAVVSGSLDKWRDAIVELNENNSTPMRILIDKVYGVFCTLGLSEVWHDYRKKPLPDTTFLLEKK